MRFVIVQKVKRTSVLVLRHWFLGTLLTIFLLFPTQAYARTTTYIGNYEVTVEDNGVKKEVVRVAGTMGKVVKSKTIDPKSKVKSEWEYTYYTTDVQGSTRQEITQTQINNPELVEGPNTYYAYGTAIPTSPSSAGSRSLNAQTQKVEDTYTGQKKDEETNLMYYNARYYNTQTGLFIQADGVDDGQNKYQYVASNPINNTDPSGNSCTFGLVGNTCWYSEIPSTNDIGLFQGNKPPEIYREATKEAMSYFKEGLLDYMRVDFHDSNNILFGGSYGVYGVNVDPYVISIRIEDFDAFSDVSTSGEMDAYLDPVTLKKHKTSTVVHESIHFLMHTQPALKDEFDKIAKESGFEKAYFFDLFDLLSVRSTTVDAMDISRVHDGYGLTNYTELPAVLAELFVGIDTDDNITNEDFKRRLPKLYEWYVENIFKQEFIDVEK